MVIENVTNEYLEKSFTRAKETEKLLKKIREEIVWNFPYVHVEVGETIKIISSDKIIATAEKTIKLLQELKAVLSDDTTK